MGGGFIRPMTWEDGGRGGGGFIRPKTWEDGGRGGGGFIRPKTWEDGGRGGGGFIPIFLLSWSVILHAKVAVQSRTMPLTTVSFNPTALRNAKTPWSFGLSECNRVKVSAS